MKLEIEGFTRRNSKSKGLQYTCTTCKEVFNMTLQQFGSNRYNLHNDYIKRILTLHSLSCKDKEGIVTLDT